MAYFSYIWIDFLVVITSIVSILYIWAIHRYGYWKRRGVYSPEASFPGGHLGDTLAGKMHIGMRLSELYLQNRHRPFIGLILLHAKALLMIDLDLLKNIMIKDFQNFSDHGVGVSVKNDPLFNHLFNLEGAEWKAIRAKLTPTFTSSKMKYMFDIVLKCSEELGNYLEEQVEAGNEINFKESMAKYSTDVIGSCAFGIETNSFKNPDAEFRRMGKKALSADLIRTIKELSAIFTPFINKSLHVKTICKEVEDFFIKTVQDTIDYRKENNIIRNDFLQLLIDMKNQDEKDGNTKSLSIIEIASQVFLFFIAGFETSSSAASYALYELAKNPEVQKKLVANIDEITAKYDGKITYESIGEMNYLTQVIEETLRMYPPLPFLFRKCNKNYQIPDTDVIIEKGTLTLIPIMGIHRNPDIHESPVEFRPERFSPENKKNMHPMASIPFGEGPRICIGNRFGMMQTRLGLISALSKYEVSACNNTIPINFDPKSFVLSAEGDQLFRVTRRKLSSK